MAAWKIQSMFLIETYFPNGHFKFDRFINLAYLTCLIRDVLLNSDGIYVTVIFVL